MRYIVDTGVLIGFGDNLEASTAALDGDAAISVATIAELQFGVLVAKDNAVRAERLRRLTWIDRHFSAIALDSAVANSYALLAADLVSAGRQPRSRSMDLWIAATAHAFQADLLTTNLDDFRGLEHRLNVIGVS